jgi:hypothetical protein
VIFWWKCISSIIRGKVPESQKEFQISYLADKRVE